MDYICLICLFNGQSRPWTHVLPKCHPTATFGVCSSCKALLSFDHLNCHQCYGEFFGTALNFHVVFMVQRILACSLFLVGSRTAVRSSSCVEQIQIIPNNSDERMKKYAASFQNLRSLPDLDASSQTRSVPDEGGTIAQLFTLLFDKVGLSLVCVCVRFYTHPSISLVVDCSTEKDAFVSTRGLLDIVTRWRWWACDLWTPAIHQTLSMSVGHTHVCAIGQLHLARSIWPIRLHVSCVALGMLFPSISRTRAYHLQHAWLCTLVCAWYRLPHCGAKERD